MRVNAIKKNTLLNNFMGPVKPILFFILLLSALVAAHGQTSVKLTKLSISQIPKTIKYKGQVKEALRWTDKLGDNILITTETGIFPTPGQAETRDAELFAYHFLVTNDSVKLLWRVYDFIKECGLDMETQFVDNSLSVTDLNNDGIAEIWVMYRLSCHGDVSPSSMKIIMYQGKKKFAMRGSAKLVVPGESYGGEYAFDNTFAAGPKEFKEFAKKLWEKNIMQPGY